MRANRFLGVVFCTVAVAQTALPIIGQQLTRAIAYRDLLHGSVFLCIGVGIIIAVFRRRFGKKALAFFYFGLLALIAFDIWIKRLIEASV